MTLARVLWVSQPGPPMKSEQPVSSYLGDLLHVLIRTNRPGGVTAQAQLPTQRIIPTSARTAFNTSRCFMRPLEAAAHSSVRLLTRGLQNWSIMCWVWPTIPPRQATGFGRLAAWAVPITRRCAGSMVARVPVHARRTAIGVSRVESRPNASDEPMWVIWM